MADNSSPVRDYAIMYYTYVLQSRKSNRLYTGYTSDLRKRFRQHSENLSGYTRGRGPYDRIYYEACQDEGDAKARELYLKTGKGKRYIKSRLKRFLSRTG
jgi:putative endonuclease